MTRKFLTLAAAACALGAASGASAFELLDWNGVHASVDNTLTVGTQLRVQSRNKSLIGLANGGTRFSVNHDDGDLAFDKGDFMSAPAKLTSAFSASYSDFGVFVRTYVMHDPHTIGHNFIDRNDFGAGKEQSLDDFARKTNEIQGKIGNDSQVLEAYAYGNFELLGRQISLRAGRQSLNWGESTFFLSGLNSILALDANRFHVPGFQLDELVNPANMVWGSMDLFSNVSIEGFYQLSWQRTLPEAAGSTFSTIDFLGIGGTRAFIDLGRAGENVGGPNAICLPPPEPGIPCVPFGNGIPRAPDREPASGGQFGGALHVTIPALNDMSLSAYGAQYHSNRPLGSATSRSSISAPTDTSNFFFEHPRDIKMVGASFNTTLPFGGLAVQGEYSHKHDQPLQIDDVEIYLTVLGLPSQLNGGVLGAGLGNQPIKGFRRKSVNTFDLSFTKVLPPMGLIAADEGLLLFEAADVYIPKLPPPSELRFDAPGTELIGDPNTAASLGQPSQKAGYATKNSWGYRFLGQLSYHGIGPLTLRPELRFAHDVAGITPYPLADFVRNRMELDYILDTEFSSFGSLMGLSGVGSSFNLSYHQFLGGGDRNLIKDRDYVEAFVKFTF